jgi:phosphoglycolate phosphatase
MARRLARFPGTPVMLHFVVFDLDGTLIDSKRDLADAANATLAEFGAPPLDEDAIGGMVGEGAAVLVRRVFEAAGFEAAPPDGVDRFLARYEDRLLIHTRPYPGIESLLGTLGREVRLAVLSNKPQGPSERTLEGLGLHTHFARIVGSGGTLPRKPDPGGLHWLMRECGADATGTVLVGDSAIDLETAHRGGVPAILVRYGFGFRERLEADVHPGDAIVDSVHGLAREIDRRVRIGEHAPERPRV